jgi:hypothetical protein
MHVRQGQLHSWHDGGHAAAAFPAAELRYREALWSASRFSLDQIKLGAAGFRRNVMLRFYSYLLGALAAALPLTPATAEELTKADPAPIITAQASQSGTIASLQGLYLVCTFYPKPGTCEDVYRQAMKDDSILAEAVRAEYTGYVRYLNGEATLSETDRQFLKDNSILVPEDLSPANQAGLHNVINDASLTGDAKRAAANNFISRAVEAELYCGFNNCGTPPKTTGSASIESLR